MKFKQFLFLMLLSFPFLLSAQESSNSEEWLEAESTILSIEKKRSGRNVKEFAMVEFTTQDGQEMQAMVELLRVPFIGSFKSVGDKVTVHYNKTNPALAETDSGNFLSK